MAKILKVENLTKKYGNKFALNNVSFDLEEGKLLGLLGPNGSGKSTLIKILAGFIKKSSGSVKICGEDPGLATKSFVSYLPDKTFLPNWMRIKDARDYYADFFVDFNKQTFADMIKVMKLDEKMRIPELSKGMEEKLNLSLILSRDARLYLLDEPIGGVDPVARDMITESIIDKAFQNKTLIVSTQLIRDIESVFDDVMILNEGEIFIKENVEKIREEHGMSVDEYFKEKYRGEL